MQNILATLYARRSVRKFTSQPVPRELLLDLTRAAMAAPSAVNRQPWAFLLVDDAERMAQCVEVIRFARHGAPAAVVVCGDLSRALPAAAREFWIQDCSAATQNILLAASGLGLGAVWCGVHPIEANVSGLRRVLGLPEHLVPLSFVCVGWPVEVPAPRTQFDAQRIFFNAYDAEKAGPPPRFTLLRLLASFFKKPEK
jgi:nitroreductase